MHALDDHFNIAQKTTKYKLNKGVNVVKRFGGNFYFQ